MASPIIQTRGLTKDFGQGRGIFDLDLDIHRGEVFGFLGPNGAGKTTTIRLFQDYLRPTAGSIRILGRDPRLHAKRLRSHIGYLPGELSLYEALTGRRLLERFGRLHGGVDWAWVKSHAKQLRADLDRRIGQLSSGNKQKVGILLALMHDPEVLIWDEPTTGLDPLNQQEVHNMIREHKKRGGTVFLSSHILPEVERVCDRVGVVRDGKLLVVKDLADFKGRDTHRLVFTFGSYPPRNVFERFPNVASVEYAKNKVRVTMSGVVDQVVKEAARYPVLDFESQDPDLEEAFLRYYRREPHA